MDSATAKSLTEAVLIFAYSTSLFSTFVSATSWLTCEGRHAEWFCGNPLPAFISPSCQEISKGPANTMAGPKDNTYLSLILPTILLHQQEPKMIDSALWMRSLYQQVALASKPAQLKRTCTPSVLNRMRQRWWTLLQPTGALSVATETWTQIGL